MSARELLGEELSTKLTDEELQQFIWDLEALASMTIKAMIRGEFQIPSHEKENDIKP